MSDRVQPGVKIDPSLWEEFKNEVKRRKGGVRGHTRNELETAIRLYLGDENDVSAVQINRRLARMESELGIEATDGGTHTPTETEHTHTPETKPAPNSARSKKLAWLESELGENPDSIPRDVIRDKVKDEYGFRGDTTRSYVEELIDRWGLVEDPRKEYDLLVSQERRRELIEQHAEDQL